MKNIFFASDFHLGISVGNVTAKEREIIVANWIDSLPNDSELYLLGDIFDCWYEYKQVIPRGYSHFFASLRKAVDRGLKIEIFSGNHDTWMFDYFQEEFNIPVHHKPLIKDIQGKMIFMGHGDGLGPDDKSYKIVKKILRNKTCQKLFSWVHPDFALKVMSKLSHTSRDTADEEPYLHDQEWLVQYCKRKLETLSIDYFVFGHRHLVIDYNITDQVKYINLGDWVKYYSFAELVNGELKICFLDHEHKIYN